MNRAYNLSQKFIIVLLICISTNLFSQNLSKTYRRVDKSMKNIPESAVQSTDSFSVFLKNKFQSDREIIRAMYFWIGNNIDYKNDTLINYYSNESQKIANEVLLSRSTICLGYTSLFHSLCKKTGIKSYLINGFSRFDGVIDSLAHSWVAAEIDSNWYFFDPTWASGIIINKRFQKKFTNQYFMIQSKDFIKTHFPFDPIFQFLDYPVTLNAFVNQQFKEKPQPTYFNYRDSLTKEESMSQLALLESSIRRRIENGVDHPFITEYLIFKQDNLLRLKETEMINRQIEITNQSISCYNKSIDFYNSYIGAKNRRFTPETSDSVAFQPLDSCKAYIDRLTILLSEISTLKYQSLTIENLKKESESITQLLPVERAFLKEFLDKRRNKTLYSTPKKSTNNKKKYYLIIRKVKKQE